MMSEEARQKIRMAKLGKSRPDMIGNKYGLGCKMTPENKQKLQKRMKGNKYTLGRKLTEKHRQAISARMRAHPHRHWLGKFGPESPVWKGGVSDAYVRRIILQRDNFTCRICGFRDPDILEIDHIKPTAIYPELDLDRDNLWALCPNCHRRKTLQDVKLVYEYKALNKILWGV